MKAELSKAFNEMKENCELTARLYKDGLIYKSFSEAYDYIDNLKDTFRQMISGMYIYDFITEEIYTEIIDMLANISAVDLLH